MTVIAANRKQMACDSLLDRGGIASRGKKMWRIEGKIVGICGDYADAMEFIEWLTNKEDKKGKPPRGDYEALVLHPDSKLTQYKRGKEFPVLEEFSAIGAGTSEALASMVCGRSPLQAVRVTCRIRTDCGPPIRVMRL